MTRDVPSLVEKWGPPKLKSVRDPRSFVRGVLVLDKTALGRSAAAARPAELIAASPTELS